MNSNIRDYDELMKRVLKITKRCIRDLNNEFQKENPPMSIAMTGKQTCISLLILDLVNDCDRIMPGDFDEVTATVLNIIGKSIKQFKLETQQKDAAHDNNQTTH